MQLNQMQSVAVKECTIWYKKDNKERPWFEISGAAGTGKTTVVREIINNLGLDMNEVIFMAYVGKATLALRRNGLNAQTIHSAIYEVITVPLYDDSGRMVLKGGHPIMTKKFKLKDRLDDNVKVIVLDEGGMVNEEMGHHILSFGIPVIVLGDKNQLPPVFGQSLFLNKPDVTLNEIMRQKEDSPIIYLSKLARYGVPIPYGSYGNGECKVIRRDELEDYHLQQSDLAICGTNKTRDIINGYIRKEIYNIDSPNIVIGDKLICRQNNWDISLGDNIALVNGLIGYVHNIHRETKSKALMEIDFRPEFMESDYFSRLPIDHKYPFKEYNTRKAINTMYGDEITFELGYCITCHLSQGSQYDTVLVYNENLSSSVYQRKWLYTAITRAQNNLILVM